MRRLSVVIPYFNAERTISRTLASVYSQSLPPAEVIVVDDGSRESAVESLSALQENYGFRSIRQENTGLSGARNAGVAAASHDLLAFLDADDLWKPRYLETLVPFFDMPDTGLVFSRLEWIDQDDQFLGVTNKVVPDPSLERLLLGNFIGSGSNFIIRRSCFDAISGFSDEVVAAEDYLLAMEFFLHQEWQAVQVPQVLIQYRRTPGGLSRNTKTMLNGLFGVYRETHKRLTLGQRMLYGLGILKMAVALNTVGMRCKLGR